VIVRCGSERVPHSCNATKIPDAMGVRINGIKWWDCVGRPGQELVEESITGNYVAARNRYGLNGESGYWFNLAP
jgi:hypothetical protein